MASTEPVRTLQDGLDASEQPNVLFVSPPAEDYMAVTLLHGLRSLLGNRVTDVPRYDVCYSTFPAPERHRVYGRGFSVFFDLPDVEVDRANVELRVARGEFDLIVFSDIWRLADLFAKWRSLLSVRATVLVDGHDSPHVYPYSGQWLRRPKFLTLPRAHVGFLYFKREWTAESQFNLWTRFLPASARGRVRRYSGLRPTSFSFFGSKIVTTPPVKARTFATHVVDPEVANAVPGSRLTYAFDSEREYYSDLQQSRFAITTKRAGWDCLRHYEIAANGAVPCFRRLRDKPATCAPHDLVPGHNCLSYEDAPDLLRQTAQLGDDHYSRIQAGALEWVRSKTTVRVAADLIASWRSSLAGTPHGQ